MPPESTYQLSNKKLLYVVVRDVSERAAEAEITKALMELEYVAEGVAIII